MVIELGPETEGAKLLLNSVRYHYGILDLANEALTLGQDRSLEVPLAGITAALWLAESHVTARGIC